MVVTRGCGQRVDNGLYITVPSSPFGRELEYFLVDPVIRWEGGNLRAPMLVPDPNGIYHVMLGIGKEYYPYFSDFYHECLELGVSKRIPNGFDPAKLTRGKSKFLLIHPRGIPNFNYTVLNIKCPKGIKREMFTGKHDCISALWPLSAIGKSSEKHQIEQDEKNGRVTIHTPSVAYTTQLPVEPRTDNGLKYASGVLLAFPLFSFEYVSKKKFVPKEVSEHFSTTEYKLEVCVE